MVSHVLLCILSWHLAIFMGYICTLWCLTFALMAAQNMPSAALVSLFLPFICEHQASWICWDLPSWLVIPWNVIPRNCSGFARVSVVVCPSFLASPGGGAAFVCLKGNIASTEHFPELSRLLGLQSLPTPCQNLSYPRGLWHLPESRSGACCPVQPMVTLLHLQLCLKTLQLVTFIQLSSAFFPLHYAFCLPKVCRSNSIPLKLTICWVAPQLSHNSVWN